MNNKWKMMLVLIRKKNKKTTCTCGQMNPAPYIMLLANDGSTSGGIRCSVNIMVKLLKKAKMNTWKKFITTKIWKSLLVRICNIKVFNVEKENVDVREG